jgi:hypothetical protein
VLVEVFPEHNWKLWQFKQTPTHFWVEAGNVKSYMAWLGEKLGFKEMEDWYKIKQSDLLENGASELLCQYPI